MNGCMCIAPRIPHGHDKRIFPEVVVPLWPLVRAGPRFPAHTAAVEFRIEPHNSGY